MLEARHFNILTDHKPLTFAFHQETSAHRASSTTWTLSRSSPNIRHISRQDNIVADTLSRDEIITAPVSHDAPATAQVDDDELRTLLVSTAALQLEKILIPGT
jgi:hypothetical protein